MRLTRCLVCPHGLRTRCPSIPLCILYPQEYYWYVVAYAQILYISENVLYMCVYSCTHTRPQAKSTQTQSPARTIAISRNTHTPFHIASIRWLDNTLPEEFNNQSIALPRQHVLLCEVCWLSDYIDPVQAQVPFLSALLLTLYLKTEKSKACNRTDQTMKGYRGGAVRGAHRNCVFVSVLDALLCI